MKFKLSTVKNLRQFLEKWKSEQNASFFINDELYDHTSCSLKNMDLLIKKYSGDTDINTCSLSTLVVENFLS